MNSKQRMTRLLRGQPVDRVGKAEAPWPETRRRWRAEGLPPDVHANDYFAFDIRRQIKIDASFRLPADVLEDGPDFQVVHTPDGGITRCWKHTGIPHPLAFGINSPADWRRLRDRLNIDANRFSFGYYGDYHHEYVTDDIGRVLEAYRTCPTRDTTFVPLSVPDPFEGFLGKLGDETLLTWLLTEPDTIADMFAAHVEFITRMTDLALDLGFRPDGVWIGGDIAYRAGMLFSPAVYRSLLMPHHRAMIDHAHRRGLPVIYHTDGDCRAAIPLLIEAGIDCLQPMEARAGLDVRDLAVRYGDRIAFMGNISVETLAVGGQAMRREVTEKVRFMAQHGYRYVYHSDHSLPDQVSLSTFQEAMELVDQCGRY